MGRFFRARKAREVRAFLEANDFSLAATHGDDSIYERQGYAYTVKIPSKDSDVIYDGTMSQIRKCIRQCGFRDADILKWWKNNGFGE